MGILPGKRLYYFVGTMKRFRFSLATIWAIQPNLLTIKEGVIIVIIPEKREQDAYSYFFGSKSFGSKTGALKK